MTETKRGKRRLERLPDFAVTTDRYCWTLHQRAIGEDEQEKYVPVGYYASLSEIVLGSVDRVWKTTSDGYMTIPDIAEARTVILTCYNVVRKLLSQLPEEVLKGPIPGLVLATQDDVLREMREVRELREVNMENRSRALANARANKQKVTETNTTEEGEEVKDDSFVDDLFN